jgi:C-terminal processing protease CtpA/Prc
MKYAGTAESVVAPAAGALPSDMAFLSQLDEAVRPQLATSQPLATFLRAGRRLSRAERQMLTEQARRMLEAIYVHLPQKRAMYAIDPIQRLKLVEYRLEQMPEADLPSDIIFHNEMTEIFTSLRDLHTNYLLAEPYAGHVAYLPFLIEEYCDERDQSRYIVSRVVDGFARPPFEPGVEVLHWNGVPIRRAIEVNASRQSGANPPARHARGLASLTIRPLVRMLPPDEEWVTLTYRAANGRRHELRQDWLVAEEPDVADALTEARATGEALGFGFDLQADRVQQTRKLLFAPGAVAAEQSIDRGLARVAAPFDRPDSLETTLPGVFRVEERGAVGYLRIFTFMVQDADAFAAEMRRLLRRLPRRGLIVDVRGNGGGNILAAEQALQLLTERTIEPQRWQFINSPLTLELARRYADLAVWEPSIAQAVETGALHSLAFPITPPAACNALGRAYAGPVVLIVDATCYSATDVFAAGFQDHQIGPVLGTSGNTGAGGANVWTHEDLQALLAPPSRPSRHGPFRPLPHGAALRVAVRRALRVGPNAGIPVEDLGVAPDHVHRMTRRDLLENNADLLQAAERLLGNG